MRRIAATNDPASSGLASNPVSPSITVSSAPPARPRDHRPSGRLSLDRCYPELLDARNHDGARAA